MSENMDIESEPINHHQENSDKTQSKKKIPLLTTRASLNKTSDSSVTLFEDHVFVFIPYEVQLTKKRIDILKNLCIKHKAQIIELEMFMWQVLPGTRVFIIISKEMKWPHLQKVVCCDHIHQVPGLIYVDCDWISQCLQKQQYLDPISFTLAHPLQLADPIGQKSEKESSLLEKKGLSNQRSDIVNGNGVQLVGPEEGLPRQQPEHFPNEHSQKMFELVTTSKELSDYSYESDANDPPETDALKAETAAIRVKKEELALAIKEEELKSWRRNYYDEDLIFLEPKPVLPCKFPADESQPLAYKKEDIKNEKGLKSEPSWHDPTFFGDEDVHVSKVIDVKKEFLSEKDLEGTIIEGIEDFNHVNKSLEGNLTEVRELKLLHPGQRSRDLFCSLTREKFPCFKGPNKANPNALIISELENVLKTYVNVKDKGRKITYKKVLDSIRCYPKKIENEEDLKHINSVGEKMKKKILEILSTGKLRQARIVENDEHHKTLTLFMNIWGVGRANAQKWYNMGLRTIDDIRRHPEILDEKQAIGLRYYEDMQTRIPRVEMEEIVRRVQEKIDEFSDIKGVYEMIPCGSYRRGKATSGDADLLMTRKDGGNYQGLVYKIIKSLEEDDFITDHLKMPNIGKYGCETYMGFCMLKEVGLHRRIDIKMYPREHFAFAVLYFTGSQNFNRSMRLFARHKGYSLSDHGLLPANRIRSESVWKGKTIPCYTEEDVFKALGLEYKRPEDRDLG